MEQRLLLNLNLVEEKGGKKEVRYVGRDLKSIPDQEKCRALLKKYQVEENICRHCESVKDLALQWTDRLNQSNYKLNRSLILASALLHDIARTSKEHARTGADWILAEGYPQVAEVIEAHHLLAREDEEKITEKTIVYLADKQISGSQRVSIEDRFEKSSGKCHTLISKVKHHLAYCQAKTVENMVYKAIENKGRENNEIN